MAGLLDYGAFGTGSPAETAQQPSGMAALLSGAYSAMGLLAKRALGNSANAVGTGTYNPAPAVETAMSAMTGGVAGVPMRAGDALLGAGPIRRLPSSSSLATPPAPTMEDMLRASRIEAVPLSQARGTQSKMQWDKFEAGDHPPPMLQNYADKPVAVRREDGEYLIFDGHHRTAKAMGDGADKLDMYVINAKDYAPEFAGRKTVQDSTDLDELLRQLMGK
jgi:hypothetical protein